MGHLITDPSTGNAINAEDFAIFKAASEGELEFKALCVSYINEHGNAEFHWPNGKWTESLQKHGHFLLMSCKSEKDFVVKSTASLMPYSTFHFEPSRELYFPNSENLTEVLNAAIHYCKIEFHEPHR